MKSLNSAEFGKSLVNGLVTVEQAASLIKGGSALAVSGPETAMDQLPAGNWIGGTTPYFMTDDGGAIVTSDHVFITDLSTLGSAEVRCYEEDALHGISHDAPDNGFALAILPAMSACHERFALEAPFYPSTFLKPTVGWIAGHMLGDDSRAWVYDGRGPHKFDNRAVVVHLEWDDHSLACPAIVNPFKPGNGPTLTFASTGFVQTECLVDGQPTAFADFLNAHGYADGRQPLVGDYGGAHVNVSIQAIDAQTGAVTLYAPAFVDVDYRMAEPLSDYPGAFETALAASRTDDAVWSCNCILNFLHGGLEGRAVGGLAGPVTFGEIAYQLLNQTMVLLRRI